ncbi:MAG: methyltransferase domain-containing protein [Deltaproteobacteria bacterium]|nr:methyltransferase domain-containing protein [Deltaproteobacteria bacterium]
MIPSAHPEDKPIRILDIGFGNGDYLRRIYEWAQKQKLKVDLSGVDLNPWAKKAAQKLTPKGLPIRYFTSNVFDFKPDEPYHIILNSLFTHHLSNEEIIKVMQWMTANAQWGWFINDLHRHCLPYYFIRYYVRLQNYNRLVRNDAPLSVARSFTRKDWENLIQRSGLEEKHLHVSWYWPFRYGVTYATTTNF